MKPPPAKPPNPPSLPSLPKLPLSAGARKEKLKQRTYAPRRNGPSGKASVSPNSPYVELHTASAFSFLRGASLPEDIVQQAAALELPAVALVDVNGVYGAPRFYQAAKQAGIRALVGAEIVLEPRPGLPVGDLKRGPLGLVPEGEVAEPADPGDTGDSGGSAERLTLLVASREGYKNLCKLATAAAHGRPKGTARTDWETLAAHAEGLWCLTGGDEGPLARLLTEEGPEAARRFLDRVRATFGGRLHVEIQRHHRREEEHRNRALVDLARRLKLPLVATNGVRYARRDEKPLHDVLTCIRHHTDLDRAGSRLAAHRERHLKSAAEMARLFADLPEAVTAAGELAARLDFTLADLGYRFPEYPLPPGESPSSYLRHITWNGARARFRPLTARAQAQIQKELDLIEKLNLAGYFLIVWDIIQFCHRENILAQGRGSAANSAVCYALSITAVDPVKMELLFERFLSEERGEWPDIDLDLPSGTQRERVIQHVYQRYGPSGRGR